MITPPSCAKSEARVFSMADIRPTDTRRSRAQQTREVFEKMEAALQDEGMTFANVVRTWFHLDDILAWYDEFNAVRNMFFTERNVFNGIVPASTGVGTANKHGAALVGAVLAIKPRSDRVQIEAVPSPLQCPALDYKSAFSRAVEVRLGGQRHLYVSGTASIDEHGASVCIDDFDGQVHHTMAVVEAILKSRQMTWTDTRRAVAYFTHLRDAAHFESLCRSCDVPDVSATAVHATICREELLFEFELDATAPARGEK
jgi:enamine deaminase RidA (YjgF/YER057c/UK114 family)